MIVSRTRRVQRRSASPLERAPSHCWLSETSTSGQVESSPLSPHMKTSISAAVNDLQTTRRSYLASDDVHRLLELSQNSATLESLFRVRIVGPLQFWLPKGCQNCNMCRSLLCFTGASPPLPHTHTQRNYAPTSYDPGKHTAENTAAPTVKRPGGGGMNNDAFVRIE